MKIKEEVDRSWNRHNSIKEEEEEERKKESLLQGCFIVAKRLEKSVKVRNYQKY